MSDDIVKICDTFIARLRDGEIYIDQSARNIMYEEKFSVDVLIITPSQAQQDTTRSLADSLAGVINDYQLAKPDHKAAAAADLLTWINIAYTNNVVHTGGTLYSQRDELKEKISELEKRQSALQADYDALAEDHQKVADDNIAWQNKHAQLTEDYNKLLKTLTAESEIGAEKL